MHGAIRLWIVIGSVFAATWSFGACKRTSEPSREEKRPAETSSSAVVPVTVAALCVDTINHYRATLGLPAYARWADGEACADGQARSDAASGTPHGAFGQCTESAQNECPGWNDTPASVISACMDAAWAEGPGTDFGRHGHYNNMSSTGYTKVACGFFTTAGGQVWSVQNFK